MQNKLPKLFDKQKIYVICEGNEEYEYLERLKALKVWDVQYEIISDNAGGNGNIPARYQDSYQNGSYELVLVFCDTEKKPYEQYEDIKRKINEFLGQLYRRFWLHRVDTLQFKDKENWSREAVEIRC